MSLEEKVKEEEEEVKEYGSKSILIVDTTENYYNNTNQEKYLISALKELGIKTKVVTSEKDAIQAFINQPFDVILSELFLDEDTFYVDNGFELTSKFRMIDRAFGGSIDDISRTYTQMCVMTSERKNIDLLKDKINITLNLSSLSKTDGYLKRPFNKEILHDLLKEVFRKNELAVFRNKEDLGRNVNDYRVERHENDKNTLGIRSKLVDTVNYLQDRIPADQNMVHPMFYTNNAGGVATNLNPDTELIQKLVRDKKEERNGSPVTHGKLKAVHFRRPPSQYLDSFYIKEFKDTKQVTQYRRDLKLFKGYNKNKGEHEKFRLSDIIMSCRSLPPLKHALLSGLLDVYRESCAIKDGFTSPPISLPEKTRKLVCELTIGPTMGATLKTINEVKESASSGKFKRWYNNLTNAIIQVNLEHLGIWQNETELMNGSKGSINDNVSSYYQENLINAFIDFKKYTKGFKGGESFNEKELSQIKHTLSIFDHLKDSDKNLFSRVLDNSPGNSGFDMVKINAGIQDILDHFGGLSKPQAYSGGRLGVIDEKVKNAIRLRLDHWDQSYKNGHSFEDVFHITDSYEANFGLFKKASLINRLKNYSFFMKNLEKRSEEGFDPKDTKHWLDFFLVGYYRNLRKRHLFITKYAPRTQNMYDDNRIDIEEYTTQKDDQRTQMIYYGEMAKQYADLGKFFFTFNVGDSFRRIKEHLTNAVVSAKISDVFPLEARKGEKNKNLSDNFSTLYNITNKITKSNEINLDESLLLASK